jgi:DNA mismatch repair protein MutS
MMKQYLQLKEEHPGFLLFFRMGDFYEMFFDDAVQASSICGIALTKRGQKGSLNVPMAGIPHHALETYLEKLLAHGVIVAICDQIESAEAARKRGSNSLVKRAITRLVTPGTLIDERLLHPKKSNYLLAVAPSTRGGHSHVDATDNPNPNPNPNSSNSSNSNNSGLLSQWDLAWVDVSTGEFCVGESSSSELAAEVARIAPAEVLLPAGGCSLLEGETTSHRPFAMTTLPAPSPSPSPRELLPPPIPSALEALLAASTLPPSLRTPTVAMLNVWNYAQQNLQAALPPLRAPQAPHLQPLLRLDAMTQRALDIYPSSSSSTAAAASSRRSSLYHPHPSHTHAHGHAHSSHHAHAHAKAKGRQTLQSQRQVRGGGRGSSPLSSPTLWQVLDHCCTAAGSRRLQSVYMAMPLIDAEQLEGRWDQVSFLMAHPHLTRNWRRHLRRVGDIERAMQRLLGGRGLPRDLALVAGALDVADQLAEELESCLTLAAAEGEGLPSTGEEVEVEVQGSPLMPPLRWQGQRLHAHFTGQVRSWRGLQSMRQQWTAAMDMEQLTAGDASGGLQAQLIRPGWSDQLDHWRMLAEKGLQQLDEFQRQLSVTMGIKKLRLRQHKVLGWVLEVPSSASSASSASGNGGIEMVHAFNATQLEQNLPPLICIQHLSSCSRWRYEPLQELVQAVSGAADHVKLLELQFFQQFVGDIVREAATLRQCASILADWDVMANFATLALDHHWIRPQIKTNTHSGGGDDAQDGNIGVDIRNGRHPVVERSLHAEGLTYTANDCALTHDSQRLWIITGPNMGGKSTFLRQNAILVLLAQMGSFVPADFMEFSLVDRLFARVGARDDIAQQQSTFMVEMLETAAILKGATARSLVIVDEIGRGTSTEDGLCIARAVLEHLLLENQCLTLFATHFSSLGQLQELQPGLIACHQTEVAILEDGHAIFHRKIVRGIAENSYGILCAELAGIPDKVIERAKSLLEAENSQKDSASGPCG